MFVSIRLFVTRVIAKFVDVFSLYWPIQKNIHLLICPSTVPKGILKICSAPNSQQVHKNYPCNVYTVQYMHYAFTLHIVLVINHSCSSRPPPPLTLNPSSSACKNQPWLACKIFLHQINRKTSD